MSEDKCAGKVFRLSLSGWIFIGLCLGVIAGFCLQGAPQISRTYIEPLGEAFISLIKMAVVPVVFFSVTQGVLSLGDARKVGGIGALAILFYVITTMCAVAIGLFFANVSDVGGGFLMKSIPDSVMAQTDVNAGAGHEITIIKSIVGMIPDNAVAPMAHGDVLKVIILGIFFGFGIIGAKEKGEPAANIITSFSDVCISIMRIIVRFSPIGVFALICPAVVENGGEVLIPLMRLVLIILIATVAHALIVYSLMVLCIARRNPFEFFKNMIAPITFAFSSSSSMATLPLTIGAAERMGVRKEVSGFVLPLGATINMDGTALGLGLSAMFIAQIYGIDLSYGQQLTILLTASFGSIGQAGVPGPAVVMLSMVLGSVGLPLEGMAVVFAVDRLLDMIRTPVNVAGDGACAVCVDALTAPRNNKSLRK